MKVINELMRMSNPTPGIFRKTLTDVQVNGTYTFTILLKSYMYNFHYCLGSVLMIVYETKK